MKRHRTGRHADRICGKHDVLGDPARIELVAVGLLDETDSHGSVVDRDHEVARRAQPGLLIRIVDHDERPPLEVLGRSRPPSSLEEQSEIGRIDRTIGELPDRTETHDGFVAVVHEQPA